ncbi:hypothetical protein NDU88_004034 [Pleurodeles waltl]|uniref:Uncharacterized protein n=1 Tax=Pleurodeles waltl TaxID=8319 RepID=A0AAV7TQC9_PLEWA|nr:hypothetical protein NDU88_004034 [Pleurodeles waltl]
MTLRGNFGALVLYSVGPHGEGPARRKAMVGPTPYQRGAPAAQFSSVVRGSQVPDALRCRDTTLSAFGAVLGSALQIISARRASRCASPNPAPPEGPTDKGGPDIAPSQPHRSLSAGESLSPAVHITGRLMLRGSQQDGGGTVPRMLAKPGHQRGLPQDQQ